MIPDGTYTAVVDRVEDSLATLQVESDDLYNLDVAAGALPEQARHADAVLRVQVEDGELVDVAYDEAETEARGERAQRRFDRLSERPSRDEGSDSSG